MANMIRAAGLGLIVALFASGTATLAQKKSLVIGIDGLGYGARGLSIADTPWIDSLINGTFAGGSYHGANTDVAFAGGQIGQVTQQPTVSGPGWSTMLTGVWANRHNVYNNSFTSPNYVSNPVYLGTLKAALPGLKTATFINWDPIDTIILNSIQTDGDANNNLDFRGNYGNDNATAAGAVAAISNLANYDALFVALDEVDIAGHSCGSAGACYQTEIEQADGLVGQMLTAMSNRPNFAAEEWQIIVTSDHGHRASGGHGGQSDLERDIPLIVASKSLEQGRLIDLVKGVSQADVAPTVLDHFDVAIPNHYFGVSREAGGSQGNPDINGDGVVFGNGTGPYETDDVTAFIFHWMKTAPSITPLPADLNIDGSVNLADWGILNLADPTMGQAAVAALHGLEVPEPSAWMLALMAIGCACRQGHCVRRRSGEMRHLC